MLVVEGVCFGYKEKIVLDTIDFSLKKGEILSVLGVSGSGKSTLLKAIYGFFDLWEGIISWEGISFKGRSFYLIEGHSQMKYLAQDFGLMPYISVAENVGKNLSNLNPKYKEERIEELLQMVQMQDFATRKPLELSGGQQQRVALAMTLAKEPEILLLDEPFSQIDAPQKASLQRNIFQYVKEKNITCIVATHHSIDALAFSDKILVMKDGKKIDFSTPHELYFQKKNKYVASLFSDVNTIINNGVEKWYYPHELKINDLGDIVFQVKKSYFVGNQYLIELENEVNTIFVYHEKNLSAGSQVKILLPKEKE